MKRFLIILQFMTRIPINKSFDVSREDYAKGTIYFPIIGFIVGGIVSLIMQLCIGFFSPVLTAIIGVITHIFVTGGIHLDGFSDTCDGIFSGRGREKILEIMKDSRLGTFGGTGLIILILTRWALYFEVLNISLIKDNIASFLMIVLISSVSARSIVMFFSYKRRYARENEGLGDLFIGKVSGKEVIINQSILVLIILLINYKFIAVYIITLLIMLLIRNYIEGIINGVTGDVLGFSIELSEIIFMILALIMRGFLWS